MSTVMGTLSVASFFLVNVMAFRAKGNVPDRVGSVGFVALIFAVTGLVLGLLSVNESDIFKLFPRLGLVVSVVAIILWGFILMVGTGRI